MYVPYVSEPVHEFHIKPYIRTYTLVVAFRPICMLWFQMAPDEAVYL